MIEYRYASDHDLDQLAEMNFQLIQDEGHRNRMGVAELRRRMADWIGGDYYAVIFESDGHAVAYSLHRETDEEVYLRQFFVSRSCRRQGIGREAVGIMHDDIWPKNKRLVVEVLTSNEAAVAFWRSVGYRDYCLTLEILPPLTQPSAPRDASGARGL